MDNLNFPSNISQLHQLFENFQIGVIQIIRDTLGGRGGVSKNVTTIFDGNFPSKGC
jgi:hypothetical protein